MSRYIHFSNTEKETACQTDIAELLKRNGERIYRNGKESYWLALWLIRLRRRRVFPEADDL